MAVVCYCHLPCRCCHCHNRSLCRTAVGTIRHEVVSKMIKLKQKENEKLSA